MMFLGVTKSARPWIYAMMYCGLTFSPLVIVLC